MKDTDSNPELPRDPLDECLKTARWPTPQAFERSRLEARWDSLSRERARFRRRLAHWTLAATVLLTAGLSWGGWILINSRSPQVVPPVRKSMEPQLANENHPQKEQENSTDIMVRPPTRYEQTAFRMIVQRKELVRVHRRPDRLIQVLNQAFNEPKADLTEMCHPLQSQRAGYEYWILSHIGTWNPAQQQTALRVLQEIGSPRAIPVLDRLSRSPELAKHAWPVALHLAPAKLLAQWAQSMKPEQQKQAIQTLLRRGAEPEALGEFLRLVASPASRRVALDVIKAEPSPPVEALFAVLKQGTTKEERHTAGLVLGQLAVPEITKQLLEIAEQQDFPPEVMIALLNSPDKDAEKFLDGTKYNPRARASVQMARLEWELISYASLLPKPLEIQ